MTENKTQPNNRSVADFIAGIPDERLRGDCQAVLELMRRITGCEPRMWGDSIVGFGQYHYRYASGREGDWFLTGFSPRKQNLTLYLAQGFDQQLDLLQRLGRHKTGKACLYIGKLSDIDLPTLEALLADSARRLAQPGGPVSDSGN